MCLLSDRAEADKVARRAQELWLACQTLHSVITEGNPDASPSAVWEHRLKPLQPELDAITAALAENSELISTVISSVPETAVTRGVWPESALAERLPFSLSNATYLVISLPIKNYNYLNSAVILIFELDFSCAFRVLHVLYYLPCETIFKAVRTLCLFLDAMSNFFSYWCTEYWVGMCVVNWLKVKGAMPQVGCRRGAHLPLTAVEPVGG